MALICFLVAGATLFPVSASAASKGAHIFVDGVPLDSRSVSKNNVSFVPFRELFEMLNMNIEYNPKLKQVAGSKGDFKITFTIGSTTAYVNGQKKVLQAAPFTQNGTTLIPLRIVGEATGHVVYFTAAGNVIQINSPAFKGAAYTVDGVQLYFSPGGPVLYGPQATIAMNQQRELAEMDAIREFTANAPKIRIVGTPPTPEEAKEPGYKGYPDYFDRNYTREPDKDGQLPPLMSEGWISLPMLSEIEQVHNLGSTEPDTIRIGNASMEQINIVTTDEYKKAKSGDFTLSGIRVKKFNGTMYLNIEDLKTAGIIK